MLSATTIRQPCLGRSVSKVPDTGDGVAGDCRSSEAAAPTAPSSGVLDILAGLVIGLVLCALIIH